MSLNLLVPVTLLLTAVAAVPENPASGPHRLEVTLAGNAGFLVRGRSHAVVIDALVEPEETSIDHFHTFPPARLLASLIRSRAADIALVTHAHRDHVDGGVAASFLRHNREAVMVGPEAVVESVLASGGQSVAGQLAAVSAGPDDPAVRLAWPGGTVTAISSVHSGHPDYEMENVLYVVELDGARILHVGDVVPSAATFTSIDPEVLAVDVAFLPSWFVTDREGRRLVETLFHPRCVVLMHVPAGRAERAAGWAQETAAQNPGFPRIVLLRAPGDSETIFI